MKSGNLEIGLAVIHFLKEVAGAVQHAASSLPQALLVNIVSIASAGTAAVVIFRLIYKDKPPHKLGPIKIPPWLPPSLLCTVIATALLLL